MSSQIVATIFKIINFVLIIIGTWIIFRRYFAQGVETGIQQEESQIIELQEQATALQRSQRLIDERIAQDKKYAQTLTKKIERWHDFSKNNLEQKMAHATLLHIAMRQRQEIQQKYIQRQWFNKQVLPLALADAKKQLIKEYASKEQQEKFIHTIIQTMKPR